MGMNPEHIVWAASGDASSQAPFSAAPRRRDTTPSFFDDTGCTRAGAVPGPNEAGDAGDASGVGAGREPLGFHLPFIWLG